MGFLVVIFVLNKALTSNGAEVPMDFFFIVSVLFFNYLAAEQHAPVRSSGRTDSFPFEKRGFSDFLFPALVDCVVLVLINRHKPAFQTLQGRHRNVILPWQVKGFSF